ncbi:MAG TPA: hypothetical protein VGS12_10435 [Caulobacteraceae bacterium]|nr:hypothetical protein [Caulobacteraceae bacterium]
MNAQTSSNRDLLGSWRTAALLYGLPSAAIVASSISISVGGAAPAPLPDAFRAAVWAIACAVMGGACLVNAARCGRVHCYFTGPFLLAVGVAAILLGAGLLPSGQESWSVLGLVLLVGAIVLMTVPEWMLGRYRHRPG